MAERQERAAPDAVLTRIGQVVMLHHAGDREEARHRFLDLWAEIGEDGDPLHRCTLAHYMADAQDDPGDELAWDLRALTAAEELTDDRAEVRESDPPDPRPGDPPAAREGAPPSAREGDRSDPRPGDPPAAREGVLAMRALYPSLHLNLAADYVRLGRTEAARTHLRRARGAADALADDRYGDGVRAAIGRLELRLGGGPEAGGEEGPPRRRP